MSDDNKTPMDWDSPVDPNAGKAMLPEGPAIFFIKSMKRDRRVVGNFGMCCVADLVLETESEIDHTQAELKVSLILHPDLQWKITQFFTSIGQRKHGDEGTFVPDWTQVEEKMGRCAISHREFTYKRGERAGTKGLDHDVAKYLTKEEVWKPAAKAPTTAAPKPTTARTY